MINQKQNVIKRHANSFKITRNTYLTGPASNRRASEKMDFAPHEHSNKTILQYSQPSHVN